MIELQSERLLNLADAARLRPPGRLGRPTHVSTVYRWITTGFRGIKLEAIRIGGSLYTSHEALQRFAERLTLEHGVATSPTVAVKRPARRSAIDRAERTLDRLGI